MIASLFLRWSKHYVASSLGIAATFPLPSPCCSLNKDGRLITRLRKNMKNQLMHLSDKLLLRKRAIIESIIDQLKNISQIEHSCHRSPANFVVHVIAGLIAYSHQDKKPGLHLNERALLAA